MSFQFAMMAAVPVIWLLLVVIVLVAFGAGLTIRLALPRWKPSATGWFALFGLLMLGLMFFGFLSLRVEHRVIRPADEIVTPVPQFAHPEPSLPPLFAPATPAPVAGESIEEMWKKLTAPRINLDETPVSESVERLADPIGPSSPQELTDAAKVILSASLPGADPFTQGWLVNAAKSILNAPLRVEASLLGQDANGQVRPEWVSDPSKITSSMRRVVATDPLKTVEECREQLEKRLRFAVADRVRWLAKQATGQSVVNSPMLADMGVTPDYILRELCPEGVYVDAVADDRGEMKRAYALVEFTPEKDGGLLQRWQSATGVRSSVSDPGGLAVAAVASGMEGYITGERPAWIDAPPKQIGNVIKFVVVSDPFLTVEECRRDADRKMQDLALNRAAELSGASLARRTGAASLAYLGLGGDYVRRELCTDEYVDVVDSSVGEMRKTYSLVEFNEAQDQLLIDRARSYSRQEGMMVVTIIGGILLASVATLFGLLKVDTWTRGYYTKRLFLGVPAAIIAVALVILNA